MFSGSTVVPRCGCYESHPNLSARTRSDQKCKSYKALKCSEVKVAKLERLTKCRFPLFGRQSPLLLHKMHLMFSGGFCSHIQGLRKSIRRIFAIFWSPSLPFFLTCFSCFSKEWTFNVLHVIFPNVCIQKKYFGACWNPA